MDNLHYLLGEDSTITISMTGVDYNDDVHSKGCHIIFLMATGACDMTFFVLVL